MSLVNRKKPSDGLEKITKCEPISPRDRNKMFTTGYSAKKEHGGLGLYIIKQVVDRKLKVLVSLLVAGFCCIPAHCTCHVSLCLAERYHACPRQPAVKSLPLKIEELEKIAVSLKEEEQRELQQQINKAYGRWEELEKKREILFADSPQRVSAWKIWLQKWQSWADHALPIIKIRALYKNLFALYQHLQRESESLELVWGHGLLVWRRGEYRIRRPLLVTRMELTFDAMKGVFSLYPVETGTVLETDMLPTSLPNLDRLVKWERSVQVA